MTTASADLEKAFDQSLAKARSAGLARFDPRGLAWLCLAPDWTVPLARWCKFPTGSVSIEQFVDNAVAAGLCKTWETMGPDGSALRWFSVTDDRRRDLVQYLQDTLGQRKLVAEAGRIADQLQAATASPSQVAAPALRIWADLVLAASRSAAAGADALWRKVQELVDRDDNTGSALDWIYAGDALVPLLGAPMAAAVARSRRYLERRYRRRIDERYLRRLLPRREQEAAVDSLLHGPDDGWALHVIGMGGVGKTMLVRSLAAGPFAQRRPLSVARVDFDHISPDYPLTRPGQLLVELSVELSARFTDADQEARYERFLDDAERLHEVSGQPTGDPLAILRTPEARAVFTSFAKLLRTLPKPVLLVLDTCEELAKLHPAGSRIHAVDATFEILEQLHHMEQSFRVLFAGRRLLAPAGRGWQADESERPPYLESLEDRPELRVFEARGFDADEVRKYLQDQRKLQVSDELFGAILAFSPELGRVPGVPKSAEPERPRYNPYDVDLLADWVETEPGIDAAAVTSVGLDGYVAARIFGRLDAELKPAAAAVALLGRFDGRLLSLAGVPGRDSKGHDTISTLLEQEWIDLEREDSRGSRFLEVRPALWPRLERYAKSAEFAADVDPVRARLLPELATHLETEPLATLSFEAVDAYLRLAGLADACAAWATIERRVVEVAGQDAETAWSWVRLVAVRLIGEATGMAISPLLAAVSATLAAAIARNEPGVDLRPQWTTVLAGARAHPDPRVAASLEARAHLGLLAADARQGRQAGGTHLWWLYEALRSGADQAGGILASVEALLEGTDRPDVTADEFGAWLRTAAVGLSGSPALAWARSLHARLLARQGNGREAIGEFAAAEDAALAAEDAATTLLDWSPPASVLQRVMAERLWLEWASGDAPDGERLRREMGEAAASRSDDGWCLVALAGIVLLDHGHVAEARKAMTDVSPLADWAPRCALHRGVPPMAEVQARILLAMGAAAEARTMLQDAIARLGEDRASDERVVRLRVVELELIRAQRDRSASSTISQAVHSGDPSLAAAGWLAAGLIEPPPSTSPGGYAEINLLDDALLHARFCSSSRAMLRDDPALATTIATRAIAAVQSAEPRGPLSITTVDLCLDALELEHLGLARRQMQATGLGRLREAVASAVAELRATVRPGVEFEWARLGLRLHVLSDASMPQLVPRHRFGRLSLAEGELLALRLPTLGMRLLDHARHRGLTTQDYGMAMAAAVVGAAASLHAGGRNAAAWRLGQAKYAWETLGHAVDGLYPWAELDATGESPLSSRTPAAEAWSGWALRLRALLGHDSKPTEDGPAELDLRTWDEGPLSAAVPPVEALAPAPSNPAKPRSLSLKDTITLLVALIVVVGVFVGLAEGLRAAVNAASPSIRLGLWPAIFLAAVLIVLLVLLGIYMPTAAVGIARGLRTRLREDVTFRSVTAEKAQVTLTVTLSVVVHRPLAAQVDKDIPLTLAPPSRPARFARHAYQTLRIKSGLHAAAYVDEPWELLLSSGKTRAGLRRRCFRVVSVAAARPPGPWPAAHHTEVVSPQWQPFADEVWNASGRGRTEKPTRQDAGAARVVHVIGTPLLTSAGWRLRVAGSRSSQVSEAFGSSQYSPAPAGQTRPLAPGLLDPDDPALDQGAIVVVQVDPSGSTVVSDPDQAGGLRQFGYQVAVAAGRPVIVVPSLPVAGASEAMWSLARSVARQRHAPSLDRTLDWVDNMRHSVIRNPKTKGEQWNRITAAYDIALLWPESDRKES